MARSWFHYSDRNGGPRNRKSDGIRRRREGPDKWKSKCEVPWGGIIVTPSLGNFPGHSKLAVYLKWWSELLVPRSKCSAYSNRNDYRSHSKYFYCTFSTWRWRHFRSWPVGIQHNACKKSRWILTSHLFYPTFIFHLPAPGCLYWPGPL